jgi:hypothetical protein
MAREGHNNCLAILAQILNDKDAQVRQEAEKTLKAIAPQLLTNAPAK